MLQEKWGPGSLKSQWLNQSGRQLNASRGFELTWVFSQQSAADFARDIFNQKDSGERSRINVVTIPRMGASQ